MFNRETILKSLNAENYYVDKHSLDLFLNDWKIESIYEDEDGLEFYDDLSLDRIKKGIALKAKGYSDEQIIVKLKRMEASVAKRPELAQPVVVNEDSVNENKEELVAQPDMVSKPDKTFTLDVSSQTLQMLAEAVAKKISDDIKNSDMATQLIEAGGYKRDNEILAKQVKELLEHNKELSLRIEHLENKQSRNFWSRFWGNR